MPKARLLPKGDNRRQCIRVLWLWLLLLLQLMLLLLLLAPIIVKSVGGVVHRNRLGGLGGLLEHLIMLLLLLLLAIVAVARRLPRASMIPAAAVVMR